MIKSQKNPYVIIYHWIQGELYDMEAIVDAIQERAKIEEALIALNKKKLSVQRDVEDVQAGNKTMTTLLKDKNDMGKMGFELDRLRKEADECQSLLDLLTCYLGKVVLPDFKKNKRMLYLKVMQQFHVQ